MPATINPSSSLVRGEATIGASFLAAYIECSPTIQEVVREMIIIINSDESDTDDVNAAVNTLCEALWPSKAADIRAAHDALCNSAEMKQIDEDIGLEHDAFSNRVRSLMSERSINQEQLARMVGITQPAVSNILTRRCRPQRRTVARFAEALGVLPAELWPSE